MKESLITAVKEAAATLNLDERLSVEINWKWMLSTCDQEELVPVVIQITKVKLLEREQR